MFSFLKKYVNVWVSILLILLPLLFIYMSTQSSPEPILVERILKSVVAPIQSLTNSIAGNFRLTWNQYIFLTQVQKENEELKERIKELEK